MGADLGRLDEKGKPSPAPGPGLAAKLAMVQPGVAKGIKMKPIMAISIGFVTLAGGLWQPSPSPFLHENPVTPGGFAPAPSFHRAPSYGAPSIRPIPGIRPLPSLGPDHFTPYRPKSVYSNRGGIDAYPSAPKPRGYIDLYHNDDN